MKAAPDSWSTSMPAREPPSGTLSKPQLAVGSFTDIYNTYFDFVWRNARRLGVPESAADDVVQEVFIVVQRRLPEYDGRAHLRAWIFGILVRAARHYRRGYQRKGARCVPLDHGDARHAISNTHEATPSVQLEGAELARLMEKLLGQLDEGKRTLLVLSELEEWTLREIAEFLGSNINTVHYRLGLAKREFERLYTRWLAGQGEAR